MKNQYRVNEQICARDVRVVSDGGAEVMPARKALELARQQELDLVEISPNAQPPVCRIVDYSKFLYQQKKHAKEMKQKQVKVETKEIRFGPQTDEHDYQFKLKHAMEFLNEGNKVRAYVFFRGRSILFKEQGEVLLLRFANDLEDYAKVVFILFAFRNRACHIVVQPHDDLAEADLASRMIVPVIEITFDVVGTPFHKLFLKVSSPCL